MFNTDRRAHLRVYSILWETTRLHMHCDFDWLSVFFIDDQITPTLMPMILFAPVVVVVSAAWTEQFSKLLFYRYSYYLYVIISDISKYTSLVCISLLFLYLCYNFFDLYYKSLTLVESVLYAFTDFSGSCSSSWKLSSTV